MTSLWLILGGGNNKKKQIPFRVTGPTVARAIAGPRDNTATEVRS